MLEVPAAALAKENVNGTALIFAEKIILARANDGRVSADRDGPAKKIRSPAGRPGSEFRLLLPE